MVKLFGQYVRSGTIILCLFESLILAAVFFGISLWYYPDAVVRADYGFLTGSTITPAACAWLLIYALGGYEASLQDSLGAIAHRMVSALLMAFGITVLLGETISLNTLPMDLMTYAFAGSYVLILGNRLFVKHGVNSDALKPRALIIGTGTAAENLYRLWRAKDLRSISLAGFATLKSKRSDCKPMISDRLPPHIVHIDIENLCDFALANEISEIVVALDDRRGTLDTRVLLDCKFHGIRISEASSFFEREVGKVDLSHLYPSWLIYSDGLKRSWLTDPTKRLFDILVSAIFLVMTSPIWILTAIAVKLDSPGPIFYRQTRVGLRGRPFDVLKFRSMRTDAEKNGPQFAKANDARVTRVGGFIRKVRIDEIPQALNVLRGEMSFVGPRPERPKFVADFEEKIPFYGDRHHVKPGITGWAQINYPYGDTLEDAREKLTYDLYYIKNYGIFLDLVIILKTLNIVIGKVGSR